MWFAGIALGALFMFFLDPARGAARRTMATDKIGKWTGKAGKAATSATKQATGQSYGVVQETVQVQPPDNPNPDDKTLKERVQSIIFADPETSRAHINVNVADGVVELRGEQPTQQAIDGLVARVKAIPNVTRIHNYLHLPNTPAPNKKSVIEVS